MRFLVSNDDGYLAPGIAVLANTLQRYGEVIVVSPERDRSAASNSLTLDRPLTARLAANGFYYVNGTPTDCVHLAVTGLLEHKPDMVFSGINHGANMGDDTLYSGTVAAATEGFLLGIPSVAISLAGKSGGNFATAATLVEQLVERFIRTPVEQPVLLNVNVPDIPQEALQGQMVTRLGRRHRAEPVIRAQSPRGETIYWVGPVGNAQDAQQGTDFWACEHHFASITPLMIDLTAYDQLGDFSAWLSK